jgi:hypothetical protein
VKKVSELNEEEKEKMRKYLTNEEKESLRGMFYDFCLGMQDVIKQASEEERRKIEEAFHRDVDLMIKLYDLFGIEYTDEDFAVSDFPKEVALFIIQALKRKKYVEEVPETKVPEGVTVVKFEMETPEFAEVVEECFKKFMEGYAGRSAVGYDHKVRFVMVHRDKPKVGYPIEVVCKDKENSIALRQTVDWVYTGEIEVVAVRRQEKAVEVAYIRKGIAKPKREPMVYTFKKTDGWTLVGEPKR